MTFETGTIWTSGPQEFTGVSLAVLMERIGVSSGRIIAHSS